MDYFWVKFVHFCAFISWMAMLFYLPRLYVYHAEHRQNSGFCDVVKIQERKLYNGIGWFGLGITLLSGLYLLHLKPELMQMPYFHLKLTAAVLLIIYHFSLGYFLRSFRLGKCALPGKFFRVWNEVPTLIMFAIIYAMIVWANS